MSKSPLTATQKLVNSVWKAVRMLDDRHEPPPKVKLDGRRGYSAGDIPTPHQTPDRE
ncbi:hypothetical protein [Microvirga calopogonii]|uniref:hypothetical protein n=1 Tax=Microvirga calopogonii TaxID=2078013 RepID=UPI0013B37F66|nr:hypothetical protein [Microvirga calopogonii]